MSLDENRSVVTEDDLDYIYTVAEWWILDSFSGHKLLDEVIEGVGPYDAPIILNDAFYSLAEDFAFNQLNEETEKRLLLVLMQNKNRLVLYAIPGLTQKSFDSSNGYSC